MNQADGGWLDTPGLDCTRTGALYQYMRAAARVQARVEEEFRSHGLSGPKFDVLMQLMRAREPVSLRLLADGQNCVPSNMTTLVDRLEAEGLVRRVDDPSDRRSKRARLTAAGEAKAREGIDLVERLNAEFDRTIGERGRYALEQLMERIAGF